MKAETQAVLLERMMQNKKIHPEFELCFPLFLVEKKTLKRLSVGDVFLLGLDTLESILIEHKGIHNVSRYAKLAFIENNSRQEVEITSIKNMVLKPFNNSEYEEVKCVFSKIDVQLFDVGSRLRLEDELFESVEIFNINSDITAEGKLIEVNDEIAIEVTKVHT